MSRKKVIPVPQPHKTRGIRMIRIVFGLAAALSILPAAQAQRCEELVPDAMNFSGLDHTIATLPQRFRDQLWNELDLDTMELGRKERATQAFAAAFNSERMRSSVERDMIANCDPQLMSDYLKGLQTAIASKMMAMEADADTPEGRQQIEHYVNVMRLQSPRESRVKLVDQLIEAQGVSEFLAEATVGMDLELRLAMMMMPAKKGELEEATAVARARTQKATELAMLYTYRNATDDELRDYIAVYNSEPFYAFVTTSNKALVKAVRAEARGLAIDLKKIGIKLVKTPEPPKAPETPPKTPEKAK